MPRTVAAVRWFGGHVCSADPMGTVANRSAPQQ